MRRFEAVVLCGWSLAETAVAARVASLLAAHADVGVVDGGAIDPHAAPAALDARGPAQLLLDDERSGERAVLDGTGVRREPRVDGDGVRWVLRALWRRGVAAAAALVLERESDGGAARAPDDAVVVRVGHPEQLVRLLDEQLEHRRRLALPAVAPAPGWGLTCAGYDVTRERVRTACFTLADGRFGATGAPLLSTANASSTLLAANVYDGDGPETHLLPGPVAWYLGHAEAPVEHLRRALDLRTGVLHDLVTAGGCAVEAVRFASLARPGTLVLRAECPDRAPHAGPLLAPPGAPEPDAGADPSVLRVAGSHGGIVAAAADTVDTSDGRRIVERVACYAAAGESVPSAHAAASRLAEARAIGHDRLLTEHRIAWAERWEDADVVVEGDDELQLAARFALFHLMASVADEGEAAVGARGLSGDGYRGHVFWDADAFVLPFLAATRPASARAMLEYRIRRLPAALDAAARAGRRGARFPWESARTGHDVTPLMAKDRTGRVVAIRTGLLEEHIVADVAWAACCYVDWTGDEAFARGPRAALLVETARYWASRIRVDADGVAHIYGVIGPDEYHEGVDDNAFTNVMARWNLRTAAAVSDELGTVDADERGRWRRLADALVDGLDPDTGLYEQFAGFRGLEPLVIAEIAPRRPIAADYLLGAERVRGAQVLKQADVLMLHHLVPDEVAPGSLEPNLLFYEPRTAHGSSLSPAIHASLLARAREFDSALTALRIAARIDLDDLTGTTGAGVHMATMGGLWQALVGGFAGIRPCRGALELDPRLPPAWRALEVRVRFRGVRVGVRIEPDVLRVVTDGPLELVVGAVRRRVSPGALCLRRAGDAWEVTS